MSQFLGTLPNTVVLSFNISTKSLSHYQWIDLVKTYEERTKVNNLT